MERQALIDTLNRAYFSEERHERALLDRLPRLLAGVRVFVDVGASLGQYTYFASRVLRDARIVAVEADPVRFEELARNAATWARETGNAIHAVHAAVTDVSGPVRFLSTGSDVSGGLFAHPVSGDAPAWTEIEVPGVRLDDLLADASPDFVKVDVEGAELRVLGGARRILAEARARWLLEVHGWKDPSTGAGSEDVFRRLEAHGYRAARLHGHELFSTGPLPMLPRLDSALRRRLRRLRGRA